MISLQEMEPTHQLDFWLGDWKVRWEGGEGSNRIEKILEGKVVREFFSAPGFHGISHSVYDTRRERWRQTWVDDSGNYWAFDGQVYPDTFVFATTDLHEGNEVYLRMVFFNIDAGALDWRWERSADGESWTELWRIHYERQENADGG